MGEKVTDDAAGPTAAYRCVTVVAGSRCADLAVPAAFPVADLLPGIVRLLVPVGVPSPAEGAEAATTPGWRLTPIGRPPLVLAESLDAAGVLDGDVLMLLDDTDQTPAPVMRTVRDAVEHGVETAYAVWDSGTRGQWARWAVVLALLGLLIPVTALPIPVGAFMAACSAVIAVMLAVQAGRTGESVCAATGVVTAGVYAAVTGIVGVRQWWLGDAGPPDVLAVPALCCALVTTAVAAVWWRPAVVATVAVGTALIPAAAVALMRSSGVDGVTAALVMAVVVVLLMGGLPRAVLAASGLSHADADERVAARLARAERWLTGCLIGAAGAALAGVLPAVAVFDRALHLLVAGVGCLMLLRARAFTLVCHGIGPRVGGMLVLAAVWWAGFRDAPSSRAELVLGTLAALIALLMAQSSAGRDPTGPVTAARVERALDVAEWLLVLAVLLGTAGELGLAHWALSVLG